MTKDAILIYPIRDSEDHDRALARITELWDASPGSREEIELDMLVTLVDWYESQHFPMGTPTPEATIRVTMENLGLTRKDLEPMIGTRARVSEVLSGKRRLTLEMIRRLHEGLGIPLEYLISPAMEGLQPRPAASRARKLTAKGKPAARTRVRAARQIAS
jgi:HTH-type transcriptional regulator/antitoxin HigA